MKKKFSRLTRMIPAAFLLAAFIFPLTIGHAQNSFRDKLRSRIKDRAQKSPAKNSPDLIETTILHDGISRAYLLHVPQNHDPSRPVALVLAFHGGGGSSRIMANDTFYKLISKSDKEGFIVAFPNGTSRFKDGKLATWNAGNCCAYARDHKVDDAGFIKKVIADIRSKYNIGDGDVFAIGMSNGGMISYRLACDLPGTFKAVASVAGTDNYDQCVSPAPVSVLHIHARDDDHVLFTGGAGQNAFRDKSQVTDFTSVPETISRWVERNGCSMPARRTLDVEGAYCEEYASCENDVTVKLCVTETGGHSWPGGVKPRSKSAQPSETLDATDMIWAFFQEKRQ